MITSEGIMIPWFLVVLILSAFLAWSFWLWNKGWDYRDKHGGEK